MDDGAQILLRNLKEIANLAPQKQKYDWRALHTIYLQAHDLGQSHLLSPLLLLSKSITFNDKMAIAITWTIEINIVCSFRRCSDVTQM